MAYQNTTSTDPVIKAEQLIVRAAKHELNSEFKTNESASIIWSFLNTTSENLWLAIDKLRSNKPETERGIHIALIILDIADTAE